MFNSLRRLADVWKENRARKLRANNDDAWMDIQWPVNARERRRQAQRKHAREQRKGQRVYYREQRQKEFARDTLKAQARVLRELPDDHPVRQNVERSIAWKQRQAKKLVTPRG